MKMVNGRPVPDTLGEMQSAQGLAAITALLTEAANLLSATKDSDNADFGGTLAVAGATELTGALTTKGDSLTTKNVGAAAAGVVATEQGNGAHHRTILAVNTTLPAIAGGGNLAVGKLLYTLPAGAIVINRAYMSLAITQTEAHINADTPDGGLGTVIGSGAVATLDGTATFENILTGQTFNNCTGTAEVKTVADQELVIEAGAAHTVHFNVADGWAADGDAAALLTGTVVLDWTFIN